MPLKSTHLCACGCGGYTNLIAKNCYSLGRVKGTPCTYIAGHAARRTDPLYAVTDRGHDTLCWIGNRQRNKAGYCCINSQEVPGGLLHRFMYQRHYKIQLDPAQCLDHLCRQRDCVNPRHLDLVDRAENNRRSINNKLNWETVKAIRAASGPYPAIGATYGISRLYVYKIKSRAVWDDKREELAPTP